MKKSIVILSSIVLLGISFVGCQKKGAGDPSISFHGRKARLCGEWTASAGTSTDINGTSSSVTTITETSAIVTSGSTNTTYTYSDKLSIKTDGTWSQAITYATTGYSTTATSSGTWNWTGGVGDVKKREQVVMETLSSVSTKTVGSTTTTSTDTYTGDNSPATIYDIYELKNKEMIIKWEGTSASTPGGTSSSKGEMTYKQ